MPLSLLLLSGRGRQDRRRRPQDRAGVGKSVEGKAEFKGSALVVWQAACSAWLRACQGPVSVLGAAVGLVVASRGRSSGKRWPNWPRPFRCRLFWVCFSGSVAVCWSAWDWPTATPRSPLHPRRNYPGGLLAHGSRRPCVPAAPIAWVRAGARPGGSSWGLSLDKSGVDLARRPGRS